MGFQLGRTYTLLFDGALEGAEVKIRSTTVGTLIQLRNLAEEEDIPGLVGLLVENLIEWNLEDAGGSPVPMTIQGVMDNLESPVLAKIMSEWRKAATGVTAPLDGPSTSGEQFPEESIPMEELSESLAS